MRAADRLRTRFGKAEVPDLSFLDELLHRGGDAFDGHLGIDAVLIVEIDVVDSQTLE
jgi:hypothetical protein